MDKIYEQESTETITLKVTKEDRQKFKRLDQFLTNNIKYLSRNFIKTLFQNNQITSPKLNQDSPNLELKKMPPEGTIIEINVPPPVPCDAIPENIPLEILFEDQHLLVINKKAGIVTHPAPGNYTGTLVNSILFHCNSIQGIGDKLRPGIVHRLDKGTSGVMVVAKNMKTHEGLISLFSKHDIIREYDALTVSKQILKSGLIKTKIERCKNNRLKMSANMTKGKDAITHYKLLKKFKHFNYLRLRLETGRTHQIRVHLSNMLKTPILMDNTYGFNKNMLNNFEEPLKILLQNYPHPLLHARILGFIHPATKQPLYFEISPPEPFRNIVLKSLKEI